MIMCVGRSEYYECVVCILTRLPRMCILVFVYRSSEWTGYDSLYSTRHGLVSLISIILVQNSAVYVWINFVAVTCTVCMYVMYMMCNAYNECLDIYGH